MVEKFYIAYSREMGEEAINQYFGSLEAAKEFLINEITYETGFAYSEFLGINEMTLNESCKYESRNLLEIDTNEIMGKSMQTLTILGVE